MIRPRDKDGKLLPRPEMWTRLGPVVRTKDSAVKVKDDRPTLIRPIPLPLQAIGSEAKNFETASGGAVEVKVPTKTTGRPTTTGKPWEADGISRQAWYKRQKKLKGEV